MTVGDRQPRAPVNGAVGDDRCAKRQPGTLRRTAILVCLAIGLAAVGPTGCAVDNDDLRRWETTMEGPKRLRAVVLHDKYPVELRVEAAMSLIRMKPRRGQRIGIKLLVEKTLALLPAETRSTILAQLIPLVMEELTRPVLPAQPGQKAPPDPSFKYKDAAYMMLTYERATIIADKALRKELERTLTQWAMADFERRLNDRSQDFGMEQLLRLIGSESVKGIPSLMTKNAKSLAKMAQLVAKLGDEETKEKASEQLVKIAEYVASPEWREHKAPELREANRRAQIEPTPEQFQKQLSRYQEETLVRIFGSMKKVGGKAVVDFCLGLAANDKASTKRRQAAFAALEGHIERDNEEHIDRLLALVAKEGTPDLVLDQAFRRIRELPRDRVVDKLYLVFKVKRWRVRRAAAATILQMSDVRHVDEFMKNLDRYATVNFALPEAITYGNYLGDLKGGNAREAIEKHMSRGQFPRRATAISYFFTFGTKQDIPKVKPFESDREKVPECEEDGECAWDCEVKKGDDPKARELKTIETLGEYVRFCVEPQMEVNKPQAKKKDDDKKKDKDDKDAKSPQDEQPESTDEQPEPTDEQPEPTDEQPAPTDEQPEPN